MDLENSKDLLDKGEDKNNLQKGERRKRKNSFTCDGNNSDSSSWEDQDSSDDEGKLEIVSPKPKKKRLVECQQQKDSGINSEDILQECGKLLGMGKSVSEKAKNFNLSRKQVKTVLKAIFKSDEMHELLR